MDLFEETQRLIRAIEDRGVPYAIAGAIAVAVHGAPRATTDIDVLVRPEDLEAARAVAAACGFVFEALPMRFADGMEVVRRTRIEREEALTVDFLLVNATLEEVWASRERRRSAAGEFCVVSRAGLIRMKTLANRPCGHPAAHRHRSMSADMRAEAITARLKDASSRSDLRRDHRLDTKVDMAPDAITRRLRLQSRLRDACLEWGRSVVIPMT